MHDSRLILNPRSRQVERELADPYQMHRTIMRAFPADLPADERVLFRVDQVRGLVVLWVRSRHTPNWAHLGPPGHHGYLLPVAGPNPQVMPVALGLQLGERYRFLLRANPTVKRDGKRHGLHQLDEQRGWLARKARSAGFEPVELRIRPEGRDRTLINRGERVHQVALLAVRYAGILEVLDPATLRAALAEGIGPAKGLGFGLLSIASSTACVPSSRDEQPSAEHNDEV